MFPRVSGGRDCTAEQRQTGRLVPVRKSLALIWDQSMAPLCRNKLEPLTMSGVVGASGDTSWKPIPLL
jgi:hypothetical protein